MPFKGLSGSRRVREKQRGPHHSDDGQWSVVGVVREQRDYTGVGVGGRADEELGVNCRQRSAHFSLDRRLLRPAKSFVSHVTFHRSASFGCPSSFAMTIGREKGKKELTITTAFYSFCYFPILCGNRCRRGMKVWLRKQALRSTCRFL